ncbi:MAG TPA: DUF1326 domain-containing protein [Blastocatellia bacterium]|nr:DUF1326 domain-containing protein [Blastocatellia bacterium]
MRKIVFLTVPILLAISAGSAMAQKPAEQDWSLNATIIEACSCTMFCQCYFNTQPSAHEGHGGMAEHYCRANFAYKVNKGHFGNVKLDGVKFWLAGDLGGDFGGGQAEWVEATFEPSVTKEQRGALAVILSHVYPFKWKSFTVAAQDATVDWQASKDRAEAKLAGGKNGVIVLHRGPGMTEEPVVIRNLKYFGVPRNDGFVLMPNEIEAYRVGPKAFEYKGSNGFMITIDINSKDIKK